MQSRMEDRSARLLRCRRWTCLWLLLLLFSPSAATGSGREGDEKVELVLYYETLCPYCSNFIVNHLVKVFDGGLIPILDLKLVPYGNARIGVNGTITCQVRFDFVHPHSCPAFRSFVLFLFLLWASLSESRLIIAVADGHLLIYLCSVGNARRVLIVACLCSLLDFTDKAPTEPQILKQIRSSPMRSNMPSRSYLAPSLLTYLCLFGLFSPSSSSKIALTSESSDKVSLGLYYESLCPYSANFIVNHLAKIFDSDLISHVDLNLVPWGNAKIKGNASFDCQHGPSECLLNTVEACAIDIWPELNEHFPLIYCIEELVYSHDYTQWESCFEPLGLDSKLVSDCYASGRGKELELEYAAETNALQPPHQYVPWVVVDGKPLYEDYENFMSYICEAYRGTAKPEACSELSLSGVRLKEARKSHPVCYMKDKTPSPAFRAVRSAAESMVG